MAQFCLFQVQVFFFHFQNFEAHCCLYFGLYLLLLILQYLYYYLQFGFYFARLLNHFFYHLLSGINGNNKLKANEGFNFKKHLANELVIYFNNVVESLKLISSPFHIECVYVDCDPANSISVLLSIQTEDIKFTVNVYMLGQSALTFYCNDELNG